MIVEQCKGVHCVDLGESFPASTQKKVTPELFLSRDGELRDIQGKFSEYVRYMLCSLVQIFIFQSLPNEYLLSNLQNLASIQPRTAAENEPCKVCPLSVFRSPSIIIPERPQVRFAHGDTQELQVDGQHEHQGIHIWGRRAYLAL